MKILYFKQKPTEEDKKTARAVGAVIRNPKACHLGDYIEECAAVFGDVPESYSHLPKHETKSKRTRKKKVEPEAESDE